MAQSIINIIETFNKCSTDTKIIIGVICLVSIYFILKVYKITVVNGLNLPELLKQLSTLFKIFKDYELKTIAGIINLTLSLTFLLISVGLFLISSFAGTIGFGDNTTVAKTSFLALFIIGSFASMWVLKKIDYQNYLIEK